MMFDEENNIIYESTEKEDEEAGTTETIITEYLIASGKIRAKSGSNFVYTYKDKDLYVNMFLMPWVPKGTETAQE